MNETYDPAAIEPRWWERWTADKVYRTPDALDDDRPKRYLLEYFPYPSGDGLSVGHCRNYVPTDVFSRYSRMSGCDVLHPMGWDAFGLPAENDAILKGLHPRDTVPRYAANYKRQMSLVGIDYDWDREINSSHPDYYRWTQWFFLLLYRRGLAYRAEAPVNWCPGCATVLANEEVEAGACWRCHSDVEPRSLPQWFFRITEYADRLLADLYDLDWPAHIKAMQRHWIGRSEGVTFTLPIADAPSPAQRERGPGSEGLQVFTTRIDTIYGLTFAVLAPEHPLVEMLTTPDHRAEVQAYVAQARRQSDIDRLSADRQRDGVFTGAHAINPATGRPIPIYVADYVLMTYGTGAIMAVPAHDQRDFEFAQRYGLPVVMTIAPPVWDGEPLTEAYTETGVMIHTGPFDGLPSDEAAERIADWLEERGVGQRTVQYRMRDWLISRQRYWGAPIPIIYCDDCGTVPVPAANLPVLLPDIDAYQPSGTGQSPLAAVPEFVHTTCPTCGGPARRETDTMGGFACSSWYFLRFASPHYDQGPFDPAAVRRWLPVDRYVGGAEHAVMHLLYARFWTKVMFDAGLIDFQEPFTRLMNQGIVHAADGRRMSKSRGNVITPDSVVERLGADTLRGFLLFMAPFEQNVNWSEDGLNGVRRWLGRVWSLAAEDVGATLVVAPGQDTATLRRITHQTIRKVTQDIEGFRFNTMIAALMEFTNALGTARDTAVYGSPAWEEAIDALLLLLAPSCPFIAEELWARRGRPYSIHQQPWPAWDETLAAEETVVVPVQVNGRLRGRLEVPTDVAQDKDELRTRALAADDVQHHIQGHEVARVVVVPGRLVNIVTC
ncbi:MAG: leucine--tRNA ligase [Chloroflexi bacterium]|nr:leucine--tRNA ligase [Chloroflexota bacterium]MBU1751193.1 leucine--tRNA ligase [Chloroflexota bacterium]